MWYNWSRVIHEKKSVPVSKNKMDVIYEIMKIIIPSSYRHNGFMVTHALGKEDLLFIIYIFLLSLLKGLRFVSNSNLCSYMRCPKWIDCHKHCVKASIFGVFLVRISAFGLNMFKIQSKYEKIWTRKTPNMDTFDAAKVILLIKLWKYYFHDFIYPAHFVSMALRNLYQSLLVFIVRDKPIILQVIE